MLRRHGAAWLGLAAMVALFRPGPMDNIPAYIRRKHGQEEVTYLHPLLEPYLKKTYGIFVYQEDIMAAAMALGGFSGPEADTLGYAIRYQVADNHVQQSSGRGIWCAFVGVAAVMVALYLAGRHEPATGAVAEPAATDGVPVAEPPATVWSWRRPTTADEEDRPPAAPFDLEVTSTSPFTTLNDDRDEPTGRDGISG